MTDPSHIQIFQNRHISGNYQVRQLSKHIVFSERIFFPKKRHLRSAEAGISSSLAFIFCAETCGLKYVLIRYLPFSAFILSSQRRISACNRTLSILSVISIKRFSSSKNPLIIFNFRLNKLIIIINCHYTI